IGSGTVDDDMNGLIEATGAGDIHFLDIRGTLGGLGTAPEDANPGSGQVDGFDVGSIGTTGTISTGHIGSGTVDDDMNGLIEATGAGTIQSLTIRHTLGTSGNVRAFDPALNFGAIGSLSVGSGTGGGSLAGSVTTMTIQQLDVDT